VTASFVPDGTITDSGASSNLFATLNARFGSASTWQYQYANALQTWAYYAPLNFKFVSDSGAAWNVAGPAQGDANFGDTRFFGYTNPHGFNGGYSYWPWTAYPSGASTGGGDSNLATNQAWKVGAWPDLYSLLLHETGLTVGLGETSSPGAVMYPVINTVYTGLTSDDIAGVQAIYGARPTSTIYSDTLATAYHLTLNSSGAVTIKTSLETKTDADYFQVTVPSGGDGTFTVTLDAGDYSLLIPQLTVYNSAGTVVGQATATTYGKTLSLKFSGLTAGQIYKIEVSPAAGVGYFSVGAYSLSAKFGGISGTSSTPPALDQYDPNSTMATAASLGSLGITTVNSLTISSSTEVDYFSFTAGTTGSYNFSSSFTQVGGTGGSLSVSVLDSSQSSLGSATSTSGSDALSASLTAGQTYYIKVWSQTGSWFDYSLSVSGPAIPTSGGSGGGGNGHHHGHGGMVLTDSELGVRNLLPGRELKGTTADISSSLSMDQSSALPSVLSFSQLATLLNAANIDGATHNQGGNYLAATSLTPWAPAAILDKLGQSLAGDYRASTSFSTLIDDDAGAVDGFWQAGPTVPLAIGASRAPPDLTAMADSTDISIAV
jgi:hypothetical protein